jgi:hypothetical protein
MDDEIVGTVSLSASTRIVFNVGEWRGRYFAGVRKFVATQKYEGPTKSGLSLNRSLLQKVVSALASLERTIPPHEGCEFKTIRKGDAEYIRIATLPDEDYEGLPLVDVREYVDTASYQGPTKRGVRFRWNLLPEVIACMREQGKKIGKYEKNEPSLFGPGFFAHEEEPEEDTERLGREAISELVGEDPKSFPDEFLNGSVVKGLCIELPEEPLYLEQESAGGFALKTRDGVFVKIRNPTEANFIIYAQLRGHRNLTLPREMIQIFKTVKAYENYVRGLRSKVVAKILKRA